MIALDFFTKHVRDFRAATGLALDTGATADHTLHLSLIVEELDEFLEAEALHDKADALADTVVVGCGYLLDAGEHCRVNVQRIVENAQRAAIAHGINLAGAFLLVHDSNMSKLIVTEAELSATLAKYSALGVEVEVREVGTGQGGPILAAFCTADCEHAPKGKLLKSSAYHAPDWSRKDVWMM